MPHNLSCAWLISVENADLYSRALQNEHVCFGPYSHHYFLWFPFGHVAAAVSTVRMVLCSEQHSSSTGEGSKQQNFASVSSLPCPHEHVKQPQPLRTQFSIQNTWFGRSIVNSCRLGYWAESALWWVRGTPSLAWGGWHTGRNTSP